MAIFSWRRAIPSDRRQAATKRRRRAVGLAEPLEPRLALSASTGDDAESQAGSLGIHPLSTTCSCPRCAAPQPPALEQRAMAMPARAQFPLADTFTLHSLPSASKRIYLDFDGHLTQNTLWQTYFNYPVVDTPAFSLDADYANFSTLELESIQDIFARVVEDFAPFEVDVTTEQPTDADLINSGGSDTRWGVRVVVGGDGAWIGSAGIAVVNSFGINDLSPAFAFADQWWKTEFNFVAGCISHEAGHTLGLAHHGYQGAEYYGGRGNWGPLMGNPDTLLTQWSNGEYAGATNPTQDDLAVITTNGGNGFGYRGDDHGNTPATATAYAGTDLTGIVERNDDVDLFRFYTGRGAVIDVTPAAIGANLDVLAEILDSTGAVVASNNPLGVLTASFNTTLTAGTYYLRVQGTGEGDPATTGYSNYGSIGQYTVRMQLEAQPSIGTVEDRVGTIQGPVANGGRTNDPRPLVSGVGVPGSIVTLTAAGVPLGTGTVAADGSWSVAVTSPLADGLHQLLVSDSLGSTATSSYAITVDTAAPPVPAITRLDDDAGPIQGPIAPSGRTDDTTPIVTGTAAAGARVTVYDNAVALGSTTADGAGTWTYTPTARPAGLHAFTATTQDDVGNESAPSAPAAQATIDVTAPAVPVIASVNDAVPPVVGGVANGGSTNDRSPTISGTGEPGSLVRVAANGVAIGQAVVSGGGTWSLTPSSPLANGGYALVATAVDDVGNASAGSTPFAVRVDTVAPVVSIARIGAGTLTIGRTAGIVFTVSEPVATFTAADVTVTGGVLSGFTGSAAAYSATFTPTPGFVGVATIAVAAGTVTDAAGNPNAASGLLSIAVDMVAPTVTITRAGGGVLAAGDTAAITFTLSEPSTTFTAGDVTVGNGSLTAFSGSGRVYTATFTPRVQFAGTATLAVAAGVFSDAAGNGNLAAQALSIPVDTVAPYVIGFGASTPAATLRIGDSVTLFTRFSERMTPQGSLTVRLNSGGQARLVAGADGVTAQGTYTVQPGEVAADLDVVAIVPNGTLRSAGGKTIAPTLPAPASSLATRHDIVVDGAVKLRDPGSGFSVDPTVIRDLGIVQRIPIRFTTPVTGVTVASFRLTLDSVVQPLVGALLQGAGQAYTLLLPVGRTRPFGIYSLGIAPGATIRATANGALVSSIASVFWGSGTSVGMVPAAPQSLVATRTAPVGDRIAARLTWAAARPNAGGAVTGYLVEYRLAGSSQWTRVRLPVAAAAAPTTVVDGLLAGMTYEFRVAAMNQAGIGGYAVSKPLLVG